MSQTEIWSQLTIIVLNYIFVSTISASNQKQTVTDLKTDLRTTKEDLMNEIKNSKESLLRESEISTDSIINIIKAEVSKELEKARKGTNENQ